MGRRQKTTLLVGLRIFRHGRSVKAGFEECDFAGSKIQPRQRSARTIVLVVAKVNNFFFAIEMQRRGALGRAILRRECALIGKTERRSRQGEWFQQSLEGAVSFTGLDTPTASLGGGAVLADSFCRYGLIVMRGGVSPGVGRLVAAPTRTTTGKLPRSTDDGKVMYMKSNPG
jgi:hypothetical protein